MEPREVRDKTETTCDQKVESTINEVTRKPSLWEAASQPQRRDGGGRKSALDSKMGGR